MTIVAIANPSPASGKTTTALSLASYLGSYGASVLLVDFDPAADATAAVCRTRGIELNHALRHELPLERCIGPSTLSRVDLVRATPALVRLEQSVSQSTLSSTLRRLAASYTYVLIDCPAALGPLTLSALAVAHHLVIPVPCEEYSPGQMEPLLHLVDDARSQVNPRLHTGILLTMARRAEDSVVGWQLRHTYGSRVFRTQIPVDGALDEVLDGRDVRTLQSPGSHAYERLSVEMATRAIVLAA